MTEIKELQDAVFAVMNGFSKDFPRMDFIFTYTVRTKNTKTLINVVRSIPGLHMGITDHNAPDIDFQSTWVSKEERSVSNKVRSGWQEAINDTWQEKKYLAHVFACVRNVRQVLIYPYGFEVHSADNIDLIAVRSNCLKNPSAGYLMSIVGTTFNGCGIPLSEKVDTTLLSKWSYPNWERTLELQGANPDFLRMGQSNRQLLVEEI